MLFVGLSDIDFILGLGFDCVISAPNKVESMRAEARPSNGDNVWWTIYT